MKKLICLLICVSLVLTLLVSCDDENRPSVPRAGEESVLSGAETPSAGTVPAETGAQSGAPASASEEENAESSAPAGEETAAAPTDDGYFVFTALEDGTFEIKAKNALDLPQSVVIPASHEGKAVSRVAYRAFYESGITSAVVPQSVTSIGAESFYGCASLVSVSLGGAKTVGSDAFRGCARLASVFLPESLSKTGDGVFAGCTALASVTVGGSLAQLGANAFENCASLKEFSAPGLRTLGQYAFIGCVSLKSVTLGSVSRIGGCAFSGCVSLETVKVSDSLSQIDWFAFERCEKLGLIEFSGSADRWRAVLKGDEWDRRTGPYVVRCTDGDINK